MIATLIWATLVAAMFATIAWAFWRIPGMLADMLAQGVLDTAIDRAVRFAMKGEKGISEETPLTLERAAKVCARSANYFARRYPGLLRRQVGGADDLLEIIISRLNLGPEVSAEEIAAHVSLERPAIAKA